MGFYRDGESAASGAHSIIAHWCAKVKGLLVALWFGYLGSFDGDETSRGTFSDLFKMFEPKKNFRFSTKSTPKSSF